MNRYLQARELVYTALLLAACGGAQHGPCEGPSECPRNPDEEMAEFQRGCHVIEDFRPCAAELAVPSVHVHDIAYFSWFGPALERASAEATYHEALTGLVMLSLPLREGDWSWQNAFLATRARPEAVEAWRTALPGGSVIHAQDGACQDEGTIVGPAQAHACCESCGSGARIQIRPGASSLLPGLQNVAIQPAAALQPWLATLQFATGDLAAQGQVALASWLPELGELREGSALLRAFLQRVEIERVDERVEVRGTPTEAEAIELATQAMIPFFSRAFMSAEGFQPGQ